MGIDLTKLSPAAKKRYITVGRRYSSEDTLAQADKTLSGLATHASALASEGFAAKDGARLAEARDGLLAAGVQRAAARTAGSLQRTAAATVFDGGKAARATARSVLGNVRRDLLDAGSTEASELVEQALRATGSSGASSTALLQQLGTLRDALVDAKVAPAAADRGGPESAIALADAITKLSGAPTVTKRGTPEQTEVLDTLDGLIVELARAARHAARNVAKHTGTGAIAQAFDLTILDGAKSPTEPPAPPPVNPISPT